MVIDVFIAVVLCLVTSAMGYLWVHVTLHPGEDRQTKNNYKLGFSVCAILAVVLIAWQTVRNADSQSSLKAQVSDLNARIAHGHIRMKIATIAVTNLSEIKPGFNPFLPGKRAMFNVTYRNVGASNMQHVGPSGTVILVEGKPDLDAIFAKLESAFKKEMKGEDLVPQEEKFLTPESSVLSESDVQKIRQGTMRILVAVIVKFSDSTGEYKQELCSLLQPPGNAPVWHACPTHVSEVKLKPNG